MPELTYNLYNQWVDMGDESHLRQIVCTGYVGHQFGCIVYFGDPAAVQSVNEWMDLMETCYASGRFPWEL